MGAKYTQYGQEIVIKCPYCSDKQGYHHKHLYVNVTKKKFVCFLCREGGPLSKLLKDFPEAVPKLDALEISAFLNDKFSRNDPPIGRRYFFQEGCKYLIDRIRCDDTQTKEAFSFLKRRGISIQQIDEYELCISDSWPRRVIFPSMNRSETEWDYYVGRLSALGPHSVGPKWRNPPSSEGFDNGAALFGMHRFYYGTTNPLVIVEGPIDAIACDGLALLGKQHTNEKIRRILNLMPETIIVALDVDARKEAISLYKKLNSVVNTYIVSNYGDASDVGELMENGYSVERVRALLMKNARKLID